MGDVAVLPGNLTGRLDPGGEFLPNSVMSFEHPPNRLYIGKPVFYVVGRDPPVAVDAAAGYAEHVPYRHPETFVGILQKIRSSDADKAFFAVDEAGNKTEFCAKVTVSGFADDIVLIVGTDLNGSVTGVKITQINETAGLGSKTNDEAWLSQFKGLSGSINLKKVKTLPTDVAAVSGATISSSAVTGGVQTVLDEAAVYLGGANDE